jgi:hypothetical protein
MATTHALALPEDMTDTDLVLERALWKSAILQGSDCRIGDGPLTLL